MNNGLGNLIWNIANKLRGPYRPPQYRRVMLPMTVLRRLDCVYGPIQEKMRERHAQLIAEGKTDDVTIHAILKKKAKKLLETEAKKNINQPVYNISNYNFKTLLDDPDSLAPNLKTYINGFAPKVREIFRHFNFEQEIERLDDNNRLFLIVQDFAQADLHLDKIDNLHMGYLFEELVRKFNEKANEEAGDHFTPRGVINLMAHLVYTDDNEIFESGIPRKIYDPTCGTGGMLSVSEKYIKDHNDRANLQMYGQEYNPESYAICCADLLIKNENIDNIAFGDTLGDGKTGDGHEGEKFHYMLANPPFGVEWKTQQLVVEKEHKDREFAGRFGAGTPRINDGALLFLLHMMAKMEEVRADGPDGSKIAIVFNGSPLFTGDAGSGESNIRRWIIENDFLDAIIALPDQMFYNTGIFTYIWLVSNKKKPERKGKIQLIDATHHYKKMNKNLGNKRYDLGDGKDGSPDHIGEIARLYGDFIHDQTSSMTVDKTPRICSKIFNNRDFGFLKITVERPLKLNFCASGDRIARLEQESAFIKLPESKKRRDAAAIEKDEKTGEALQDSIRAMLGAMDEKIYMNRDEFTTALMTQAKTAGVALEGAVKKAILNALSERDETADTCMKAGKPEPDSDLRDTESVPLPKEVEFPLPIDYSDRANNEGLVKLMRTHCEAYLAKEVLPYVPEAWIDYSKTKVGYEIPLTRKFYVSEPPRDLADIEAEIDKQQKQIRDTLGGIIS